MSKNSIDSMKGESSNNLAFVRLDILFFELNKYWLLFMAEMVHRMLIVYFIVRLSQIFH